MSDDALATVDEATDTPLVALTDREQKVAEWLAGSAFPSVDPDTPAVTAEEFGQTLSPPICRATVYKTAKRPHVMAAARQLVRDQLEYNQLPKIQRNVLKKAEEDAEFGFKVLKYLAERLDMDMFGLGAPKPRNPIAAVQVNVTQNPATGGTFEDRVRMLREKEGTGDAIVVDVIDG